jgi:hypothetical protein
LSIVEVTSMTLPATWACFKTGSMTVTRQRRVVALRLIIINALSYALANDSIMKLLSLGDELGEVMFFRFTSVIAVDTFMKPLSAVQPLSVN